MPKYPKKSLDDKLAWMRDKQKQRAEALRKQTEEAAPAPQIRPPQELPQLPLMLRVPEVAAILSVSISTVKRWFADRAVIVHPGPCRTTMLIPQKALDEWCAANGPEGRRVSSPPSLAVEGTRPALRR